MADLKKENFSLKLKIYYLETTLSKVSGAEQYDVLEEVRERSWGGQGWIQQENIGGVVTT